mmetsp:Transcript_116521/g.228626  ORF Transcript_116521/g.228626 Transcript_116521/m.228626 type:complete len:690 (+) Transcript_116521:28-2097(+)
MEGIIDQLLLEVKRIDELCSPSDSASGNYRELLKKLYDASGAVSRRQIGPLLELTTNGLDDESIWEQLQTRNNPLLKFTEKSLKRIKKRVDFFLEQQAEQSEEEASEMDEVEDEIEDGDEESTNSEPESEENYDESDEDNGEDNEEMDESDGELAGNSDQASLDSDDRMEAWLDQEDEMEIDRQYKAEKRGGNPDDGEDDVEGPGADDLKYVQETLYDLSDEDSDDEEGGISSKFNDFFIPEKSELKGSKNGLSSKDIKQRVLKSSSNDESEEEEDEKEEQDDDDDDEDDDEEEEGYDDSEEEEDEVEDASDEEGGEGNSTAAKDQNASVSRPSSKRHQMLFSQIADLEEDLMAAKPWELRGEVKAADRPENSFLSLHADIERTSKPAPIVTQAFTSSMEEMIKRRIKEGNFSDVLPPAPEKGADREGSDELELSQEKNKLGLGEVYAEDFLAKSLNAQPEAVSKKLEQDRAEAQELFHKVSRQLDALSHFHFTPRPIVADTKLKTLQPNASALSSLLLEDITPITAMSAVTSQLAPEQIQQKKLGKEASMMAEEEMTSEDRKRKRRASKAANKAKKVREADEAMYTGHNATGPAAEAAKAKEDSRALDEQLKRDSRVTLAGGAAQSGKRGGSKNTQSEGNDASYAKSASFFSKLQQETSDQIKKKTAQKGGKPAITNPFSSSANSLKL